MAINSGNQEAIGRLSRSLKNIFDKEIVAGNEVVETYIGDWPYQDTTMVFLKKPFLTPIQRSIPGVEYRLINDPHYWKAQYHDLESKTLLCCKFDGPNFNPL